MSPPAPSIQESMPDSGTIKCCAPIQRHVRRGGSSLDQTAVKSRGYAPPPMKGRCLWGSNTRVRLQRSTTRLTRSTTARGRMVRPGRGPAHRALSSPKTTAVQSEVSVSFPRSLGKLIHFEGPNPPEGLRQESVCMFPFSSDGSLIRRSQRIK